MKVYSQLRCLAKSTQFQNLFAASKEIFGIKLFRNSFDFSNIQMIFLNYLYMYDSIMRDIATENISKEVLSDEIYEDAYMLYKKENRNKTVKDNKNTIRNFHLVPAQKMIFPKKSK